MAGPGKAKNRNCTGGCGARYSDRGDAAVGCPQKAEIDKNIGDQQAVGSRDGPRWVDAVWNQIHPAPRGVKGNERTLRRIPVCRCHSRNEDMPSAMPNKAMRGVDRVVIWHSS